MNRLFRLGVILLLGFLGGSGLRAHVGSPHIVFEGRAGTVPVRIVVRQPEVVPGLADISVRLLGGEAERVTVLPLHWTTGKDGAPRPDVAERVPGDSNLYTASLWFMARGAYGVEVRVEGPAGGAVMVPVNSVSYERRPMPPGLGATLAGLGFLLVAGAVGIVAAAAREATLSAGVIPGRRRSWASLAAGVGALGCVGMAVWGGSRWWESEDLRHVRRNLFRQFTHSLSLVRGAGGGAVELRTEIIDPRRSEPPYRLVPDHGKLIHQFVVAEDGGTNSGIPTFAHLHPVKRGAHEYVVALPAMPSGRYRVFTDLTHESGSTQTLTNSVVFPEAVSGAAAGDPADSGLPAVPDPSNPAPLGDGLSLHFAAEVAAAGDVSLLGARVTRADGTPAPLEPYLRMLGHAVVMRSDGGVFAHVHPAGTLSMSAARTFATRTGGEASGRQADANCGDLEAVPPDLARALGRSGEVRFPYVFPEPGRYWVWIQVQVAGRVRTAGFPVVVPETKAPARG